MSPKVEAFGKLIRLVFMEERRDRFEHLLETVESISIGTSRPPKLVVSTLHGDCGKDLLPALTSLHSWRQPIFANLDGFGADVPFAVVDRIGKNVSSEVLVTVAPSFFVRFASVQDLEAGDLVFGDRGWRHVRHCSSPEDKRRFLVNSYREALKRAGFKWTLHFEMTDEGGHKLFLFFATSVELGVDKMKDAMWKTDPNLGLRFRDARDTGQLSFAIDAPDLTPLKANLIAYLKGNGKANVGALRRHTLLETIYRMPHATTALRELRNAGVVSVIPKTVATSSKVTLAH